MARKPRKPPEGMAALRRRYASELERLRAEYELRALEQQRAARARETDYQIMARQFRREIATLRRKGLLPTVEDARKVRPTSQLSRALNDLYDVVTGRARAVRVAPETAKQLREEGYTVTRGRVLLGQRQTVRGGEVFEREGIVRGTPGRRVQIVRLRADMERQVDAIVAGLRPGEYIGFEVGGTHYTQLFNRLDRDRIINYLQGGGSMQVTSLKTLTITYVSGADVLAYEMQRQESKAAHREATRDLRREMARRRARRRRARKRGIRTERGH